MMCRERREAHPDRHARAQSATAHALRELRRGDAQPSEISAQLATIWRARYGPIERLFLTNVGALSLDPEPLLDLGDAIQDEHGTAPGHVIEARRQALIEQWRKERGQ